MPANRSASTRKIIKELASAVSMQAQITNRTWLSLVTVAVISLLPTPSTPQGVAEVTLPFSFGKVEAETFHLILFPLLTVLSIAFSAAYSQQVRAQKLAQSFLNSINNRPVGFGGVYPRELFDMLRLPTLNRIAPLAQSLRGPYQFHKTASNCPRWLRVTTTVYYILLKLTSMLVYFGLPAFALLHVYQKIQAVQSVRWLAIFAGIFAALALLQVCVVEVLYSAKVVPEIWSGGSKLLESNGLVTQQ
jgi:hypothetical protein